MSINLHLTWDQVVLSIGLFVFIGLPLIVILLAVFVPSSIGNCK